MNNEKPEKIYHDPDIGTFGYEECEGDTVYIREDIVQGLVKALEAVVRYAGCNGDDYLADQVRAALTKARVKEEG